MKIIILENKNKKFNLDAVVVAANDIEEAELLVIKICKQKNLQYNSKMTSRVLGDADKSFEKPTIIYNLIQNNPVKTKKVETKIENAETTDSDK